MRLEVIDEYTLVIFIPKPFLKDIDIYKKSGVKDNFKKIIELIKKYQYIDLKGYYDVLVYGDNNYGIIIDFKQIDSEYYSTYDKVDMRINFKLDHIFLYEIEDYFIVDKFKIKNIEVFYFNNKFYIKSNSKISEKKYLKLIENSNIVYDEELICKIVRSKKML